MELCYEECRELQDNLIDSIEGVKLIVDCKEFHRKEDELKLKYKTAMKKTKVLMPGLDKEETEGLQEATKIMCGQYDVWEEVWNIAEKGFAERSRKRCQQFALALGNSRTELRKYMIEKSVTTVTSLTSYFMT